MDPFLGLVLLVGPARWRTLLWRGLWTWCEYCCKCIYVMYMYIYIYILRYIICSVYAFMYSCTYPYIILYLYVSICTYGEISRIHCASKSTGEASFKKAWKNPYFQTNPNHVVAHNHLHHIKWTYTCVHKYNYIYHNISSYPHYTPLVPPPCWFGFMCFSSEMK